MITTIGIYFRKLAFAGFLFSMLFSSQKLSAQEGWYFNSSVQFSGGNYVFDSYNRVFSVYGGLRYQNDFFGITASLPIVSNNSNFSQTSGMMLPTGNSGSTANSMQGMSLGIGDLYTYLDYKIISDYETGIDVYANAQVKIPTASANMSFGTGKFDVGASLTLRKSLESFVGILDLGYLNIGDPASVVYKDPLTYGIGLGKFFNYGEYSLLLYYTGYTTVIDGFDTPKQISLGANYRLSDTIILSVIGSAGIGNTSPDFTLSSGVRVKL